jgi:hypothetical protein
LFKDLETDFHGRDLCGEVERWDKFWLVAISDLKRGLSRGTMGADVVGELRKGKEIGPIVLLEIAEDTEELFDLLVDAFGFSIGLWMKGGG